MIDLHIHSIYSDGELSPDELITECYNKNINTISITDHDTIMAYSNISNDKLINIISGIELTAKVDTGRMHILGYGIDINNQKLNNKMEELKNNSFYSVLSILNQIKNDYNLKFKTEDLQNLFNQNNNLGRPDIAKLCMKYGYVSTTQEAFDKYLINAYNKIRKNDKGLSYEECIDLILSANGVPILAHPHSLELDNNELEKLILKMTKLGLMGIEVYHSNNKKEETEFYKQLINKYNLLYSGGTDYHGSIIKPDVELGTGRNNNILIKKLSIINYLNSKRELLKEGNNDGIYKF